MNLDAASDIDQNAHPRELSAGSPGPVAAGPIIALPGLAHRSASPGRVSRSVSDVGKRVVCAAAIV